MRPSYQEPGNNIHPQKSLPAQLCTSAAWWSVSCESSRPAAGLSSPIVVPEIWSAWLQMKSSLCYQANSLASHINFRQNKFSNCFNKQRNKDYRPQSDKSNVYVHYCQAQCPACRLSKCTLTLASGSQAADRELRNCVVHFIFIIALHRWGSEILFDNQRLCGSHLVFETYSQDLIQIFERMKLFSRIEKSYFKESYFLRKNEMQEFFFTTGLKSFYRILGRRL